MVVVQVVLMFVDRIMNAFLARDMILSMEIVLLKRFPAVQGPGWSEFCEGRYGQKKLGPLFFR